MTGDIGRAGGGAIELVDLRKEYGDAVAVAGIDLRVEAGEFFSLLGPSGCGKTNRPADDRWVRPAHRRPDPPLRRGSDGIARGAAQLDKPVLVAATLPELMPEQTAEFLVDAGMIPSQA